MRVLLVGGLGFIGKHLIRRLADAYDVSVFSNRSSLQSNEDFVKYRRVRVWSGDITNAAEIEEAVLEERPSAVVHLAALTGIARCNADPSLAFQVNVGGTYNIVKTSAEALARLVFISSREVYGETLGYQTSETDALMPNNLYGLTKLFGERLVLWAESKLGLEYTILRLTNVYGPEGDQYNVQAMLRLALKEGVIRILGGEQHMNLLYVEDAARAIEMCLHDTRASKQIFNVGSSDNVTVRDIATKIESLLKTPINIEYGPMREGETRYFRPDLTKIQDTLGFFARTSALEGLTKTVNWYTAHAESQHFGAAR